MVFRKILLFMAVLLVFAEFGAQQLIPLNEQAYVKTVEEKMKTDPDRKVRLLNALLLCEYWAQTDCLKSKTALNTVLQSKDKNVVPKGVLAYYQGIFETYQGSTSAAKKYFEEAINGLKNDKENTELLIKSYYHHGYIQIEDLGYEILVKTLTEKCIPLSEKNGNLKFLAYGYTQLGLTFMSVAQLDKAEEYHQKALALLSKIPEDETVHLITYLNTVSNYCYKPDSRTAFVYLNKAKQLISKYPDSQHYPNYYYQEALYYTTKQDYPNALKSLDQGVAMAKAKHQLKILHLLYFRRYNVFLMQKDYTKAKAQLEQILKENILSREAMNRRITYTQLAAVNDILGNHKEAYQWMKKSSTLNDSLQGKKLLEKMNELEILHETSQKQKTINQLKQEKKENELIAKNKNLRITVLAIALGLSLIIAFLIYLTYRKEQKLSRQIRISHQQDLLHMENERKYEATKAVLQGEEQERQRIAQDLHDSMGGMLANIRMLISSEEPSTKEKEVVKKIDQSISEMRRISRNLMPETLKNLGLEIALKELCESMSHPSLSIQFEAFDISDAVPFDTQLALYRIAQESISNVIKYAQAQHVIVQISQHENTLSLTVEDDGIGFNLSEVSYGLGIKNIKNRAQLIGGTVDLISETGSGTTITVECQI